MSPLEDVPSLYIIGDVKNEDQIYCNCGKSIQSVNSTLKKWFNRFQKQHQKSLPRVHCIRNN